jgi:GNAT superfamily N-acetyltransferase
MRPRPNIDQLRRQARELLRAAQSGDVPSLDRLESLSLPSTLAGAQLAVAREHGFSSWVKFKEEVERRAAEAPLRFVLRRVRSPEELRSHWLVVHAIFGQHPPREKPHWRVFEDFEVQRTTMLVVEHEGRPIGGAIRLNLVALEPWARGIGLGRRVVQTVEAELLAVGGKLGAHADPDNRGFFLRLGYSDSGRGGRHMSKGSPTPRLLARRLELWRRRAGDLDDGVLLEVDPTTGKIPGLAW